MNTDIDWSSQHCGVHQAEANEMFELMPDLQSMIEETFPEDVNDFIWDVRS